MRNVRIGLRTKDEPDTSAASRVRTRTRRQQTALNRRCCTVDDAAKRSAERELTNEARAEGKLACPLPCKEEEDEVNDRSSRLYGVPARTVSPSGHSFSAQSSVADAMPQPSASQWGQWWGFHLFAHVRCPLRSESRKRVDRRGKQWAKPNLLINRLFASMSTTD